MGSCAAVAGAAPRGRSDLPDDLAGLREDLVQIALLRLLETARRGEGKPVGSTPYLVQVTFTTVAGEIRRAPP